MSLANKPVINNNCLTYCQIYAGLFMKELIRIYKTNRVIPRQEIDINIVSKLEKTDDTN